MSEPGRAERALARVGRFFDARWRRDPRPARRTRDWRAAGKRLLQWIVLLAALAAAVAVVAHVSAATRDALVAVGGLAVFAAAALSARASLVIARESQHREARAAIRQYISSLTEALAAIESTVDKARLLYGTAGEGVDLWQTMWEERRPRIDTAMRTAWRMVDDLPADLREDARRSLRDYGATYKGLLLLATAIEQVFGPVPVAWSEVSDRYADLVSKATSKGPSGQNPPPTTLGSMLDVETQRARQDEVRRVRRLLGTVLDTIR